MKPTSLLANISIVLLCMFNLVLIGIAQNASTLSEQEQYFLILPRADQYQSVVTVDDASGIFLNPAAGGLMNGFNLNYTGFLGKDHYAGTQVGIVGIPLLNVIGFRQQFDKDAANKVTSWIISSASGTRQFSMNFALEFLASNFGRTQSATAYHLGFIARPSRGFSLGYSFRNIGDVPLGDVTLRSTHDFGIGIRPMGNDRFTITADGQMNSRQSFKNMGYKVGAAIKIMPGLNLQGLWSKNEIFGKNLSLGLSFSIPTVTLDGHGVRDDAGDFSSSSFGITLHSHEKKTFIKKKHQIAEMKFQGVYTDYSIAPMEIFGIPIGAPVRGVQSMIDELDAIAKNEEIDVLLLNVESFSSQYNIFGMSAALQELGSALQRVRDRGKHIVAFLAPGNGFGSGISELFLASYANTIFMSEYSGIFQYGIAYDAIKLRRAIQKFLKIDFRTYTAGKYKSSLNQMGDSLPQHKVEELQSLVDDLYAQMLARLHEGRKLNMNALADTLSGQLFPEEAKALGIIDSIGWYDDAKHFAYKTATGDTLPRERKPPVVHLLQKNYWNEEWAKGKTIAVIGVYGGITQGSSSPGGLPIPFFGGERTTGSESIERLVKKAESDASVKAIVLRVDSPGGSAVGSDEMYRVLEKIKKPVVISMGDLAASGGYYISSFGKKIFASPATLTASIGVIGQVPFLYQLVRDYDVYVKSFVKGKYSNAFDLAHEPTPEFEQGMKRVLDHTYEKFLARIHAGRKISLDTLREIAQGRIYTGAQAKQHRLIDEFGGLHEAIEHLKKTHELGDDIEIEYYPVADVGFNDLIEGAKLFGGLAAWWKKLSDEPMIELR